MYDRVEAFNETMHAKAQNVFDLYGTDLATRAGFQSVSATVQSRFNLMNPGPKRPTFSLYR